MKPKATKSHDCWSILKIQSSQLADPLWTDPGLKNGTGAHELELIPSEKKPAGRAVQDNCAHSPDNCAHSPDNCAHSSDHCKHCVLCAGEDIICEQWKGRYFHPLQGLAGSQTDYQTNNSIQVSLLFHY